MCCRLVAQPVCMIQPVISGQLQVKVNAFLQISLHLDYKKTVLNLFLILILDSLCALTQPEEDSDDWEDFECVLRGQNLLCYQTQEELESEDKPLVVIPIRKVGLKQEQVQRCIVIITFQNHKSALVN